MADPGRWPVWARLVTANLVTQISGPNKGREGQEEEEATQGDMDAMRGYGVDMYGEGDFNETRGRNLCSVCKEPSHKASRQRRRGQQVHT